MKTRRILLIEDDDTIAYGLTELLADEGFETISVRFLKEAMEAVRGVTERLCVCGIYKKGLFVNE